MRRKNLLYLPKTHPLGRIAPIEHVDNGINIVQKEQKNKGNKRTSKEMRKDGEIKSKIINLTPVGILRTKRKDIELSRKKHTSDQDSASSTQERNKRTTKINPKKSMTNMFPRESEIVLGTQNDERHTKPQHKTKTNENTGQTRDQKTGKPKQEKRENGRNTKMENLLKGIRNQGTITTKEIKREKIEYIQKYPP